MKFLHLSDCHLDAPLIELRQYNKSNDRRKELRQTFSDALEIGKNFGVDVILISGDLFEHQYITKSTIEYINSEFQKISDINIFISPGNHDPFLHNSYYNTFNWSKNVHIFSDFEKVSLPKINTEIYGIGLKDFNVDKNMINDFSIDKNKINILITHGTLNTLGSFDKYHPIDEQHLMSLDLDYCALGHIHKPIINDESGICYCGSTEPLGFDELGEHGIILGEINKNYKVINFKSISKRKYIIKEVDITNLSSFQEITEEIKYSFNSDANKQDFVKINLIGNIQSDLIDIEMLKEHFENQFYYLKIVDKTNDLYLLENIEDQNNIKGLFVKRMNDLIKKAPQQDKDMLNKALQYGIDSLIRGEIKL